MSAPQSSSTEKRVDSVIKQRHKAADKLRDAERIPLIESGPYKGVEYTSGNNNSDEATLVAYAGNFTKGMAHDPNTGLIANPDHYKALTNALQSRNSDTEFPSMSVGIDEIDKGYQPALSKKARPLVNPLAGVAGDITGIDAPSTSIPPAPEMGSHQAGAEMVELYWMSELRDVPFDQFANNNTFGQAVEELNELNQNGEIPFAEHYINGAISREVNASTVFRGSAPGNDTGDYISQFLLQPVSFGTLDFEQKQQLLKSNQDYMTSRENWLEVQNGKDTNAARSKLEQKGSGRHIVTFRDLAHYVHFDALHQAYFNAALILDGWGDVVTNTNPYNKKTTQAGFGTLGGPHVLVAVTEVATRALKAIWQQKWYVHRRLRPESMAGRVEYGHNELIHDALLESKALVASRKRNGNCLLPMVFPEGSPMHPSYGAGHATVAGACVTVLKAFFNTGAKIEKPVKAVLQKNGNTTLKDDTTAGTLTIGGELNKLAANIAIGRNGAGVHYRTDYTASMALGELVALSMLQEQAMFLREGSGYETAFQVERFDGSQIKIKFDGSWEAVDTPVDTPAATTFSASESTGTTAFEPQPGRAGAPPQKSLYSD